MIRLINFKSQRQAEEWKDLKLDSRLRLITYSLAGFVFDRYQKVLVVTCILRTEEERREIYKDDPALRDTVGVHEVWRAIDLRTIGFTPDEIGEMVQFLNDNFVYTGNHSTALPHIVIGFHLHIQVDGDGVTEIKGKPVEVLAVA